MQRQAWWRVLRLSELIQQRCSKESSYTYEKVV